MCSLAVIFGTSSGYYRSPSAPVLQHMKRPYPESCSAARPASLVAYVDCPRRCWIRSRNLVSQAIQKAVDGGATIINLTFDRDTDAKEWLPNVWDVLKAAWGEELCSASVGGVMSFYAGLHWVCVDSQTIDPERGLPAIMLTLRKRESPGVKMSVATVCLPELPVRIQDRILDVYVTEAFAKQSQTVLIGGVFNGEAPLLWLQNCANSLSLEIAHVERLCVIPWCTTGSIKCIEFDATCPYALVIEHEPSTAELPAASTRSKASRDSNSASRSIAEQLATSRGSNVPPGPEKKKQD